MLKKQENKIDFGKINEIAALHIEKILDHFKIEYKTYNDRVAFPCPIHDSARDESCTVYIRGGRYVGNFVCWTNHCEESGRGAINLIKFLLKKSFMETVRWILEFTNSSTPQVDEDYKLKKQFVSTISGFQIKDESESKRKGVPRDVVRKSLLIPGDYYLKRGFSKEILDRYDVGFCNTRGKPMYMRTVVPVYDDGLMIGCVGRSINPECPLCKMYHQPGKPCPSKFSRIYAKWVNSDGFSTGSNFYNLWNAKEHIKKTQNVILVEGQGDVWRLEESGIKIGLGLFGCKLTAEQATILESSGAMNVYLALDSDEKGQEGIAKIREKISRFYNICEIKLPDKAKDLGDLSIVEINKLFRGVQSA